MLILNLGGLRKTAGLYTRRPQNDAYTIYGKLKLKWTLVGL
jgi:hypothetical protein